ncbi:MAG: 16S rRNA (guanine(527)-N(7))-methyltransferase RsmG [Tepidisphaeraceae bacterium]
MSGLPILWTQLADAAGVRLSDKQLDLLSRYLDLLLEANLTMNLTALKERGAAEVLHVGDALTLLPYLTAGEVFIADIGSGGGSPAIPLAIARSDASMTCIESTGKKAAFLTATAAALELKNLKVVNGRAEDSGRGPAREKFDIATARAVGTLDWVAEYCLPLVKIGGKVLAMKGKRAAEELGTARKAIRVLGGAEPVVHPVALPGTEGHVIVEIVKMRKTPDAFPRLPSIAKGKPIR